nr:uncharacterized protein CI109_003816 [Kwoniella shandongensis]KAA5527844.1 hypothetical protein CI109_003816 [Kwoniella shandongensis]
MSTPSVLIHQPSQGLATFDGFGGSSTFPMGEGSTSPGRRQRISMACQYCRHRKIRCCGGAPCRNCTRAKRDCEYAPVPEEVNKATREKKAIAKAARSNHYIPPATTSSPYFLDQPTFEVPYVSGPTHLRPSSQPQPHSHPGHRRSVSMPNNGVGPWVTPPPAPSLHSPPMFESPQWMYSSWNSGVQYPGPNGEQPPPAFPSVLEHTPMHHAYLSGQMSAVSLNSPSGDSVPPSTTRASSADTDLHFHGHPQTQWSTPNLPTPTYLRPPVPLTPITTKSGHYTHSSPATPGSVIFQSPFPTPPLFQYPLAGAQPIPPAPLYYSPSPLAQSDSNSPTLAPAMELPAKEQLIGLGIGMSDSHLEYYQTPTPTYSHEEYFSTPLPVPQY